MTDPKEPRRRLIHETREERTYEEIPEDESAANGAEMGADDELGEDETGDGEDEQQANGQNPPSRKRGPNTGGRRVR